MPARSLSVFVILLAGALLAGCQKDRLEIVPPGDGTWEGALEFSDRASAEAAASILRSRLGALGVRFTVATEGRVVETHLEGFHRAATPMLRHLATTRGMVGIHRVREGSAFAQWFESASEETTKELGLRRGADGALSLISDSEESLERAMTDIRSVPGSILPEHMLALRPPTRGLPKWELFMLHKRPELERDSIESAKLTQDPIGTAIEITLTSDGAKTFHDLTKTMIGKRVAVALEGRVLTAPLVRDPIAGGVFRIESGSTEPPLAHVQGELWRLLLTLDPFPGEARPL
ncbi:MAG: hypothetical protein AAFY60_21980 [Myxococcota bacterium]